jgi:hypothetical protein
VSAPDERLGGSVQGYRAPGRIRTCDLVIRSDLL